MRIEKGKKYTPPERSPPVIIGEGATVEWKYLGETDSGKAYAFEVPKLGVVMLPKSRIQERQGNNGDLCFAIEGGFLDYVLENARKKVQLGVGQG